ncbi:P-loop containing nucleoside triphosphate hydrolase protein, partial [Mycena leptocephala]
LPGEPKIFHGRNAELDMVVKMLGQESSRIAILGGGGMGKTTLAKAVLHHSTVVAGYERRLFVATDSATNSLGLAALVGAYIGLKPGKDLTRPVVRYFSGGPPCLLILDNLETSWEPITSRTGVEDFLSLLSEIPHLALIITMRGAERPAKVRWSHPFLSPLKPLSDAAARQTFIDVADDVHNSKDIDQLLALTDNMPLAVELIAHLVDHEDCANVLARWETEKTALLSDGYDKRSNLDASIEISLSSPRITSLPGTKELLALLSILPDGLSDVELVQIQLPIENILTCKATLIGTSLAYMDDAKRLKSLSPIREHVHRFHPP